MRVGPGQERMAHLRGMLEPLLAAHGRFARKVSVAGPIDAALPDGGLPLGCIHQVKGMTLASGITFSSILASRISVNQGRIVYVSPDQTLHPLGLLPFGIAVDRVVHVVAKRPADVAWATLEALRCHQVAAVLALVQSADLTLCRRFQLAAESSGATGFLLTDASAKPTTPIASVITRWQVSAIPAPKTSPFYEPCWEIDLAYCRGGRPASWQMAWRQHQLELLAPTVTVQPDGYPLRMAESAMRVNRHPHSLAG